MFRGRERHAGSFCILNYVCLIAKIRLFVHFSHFPSHYIHVPFKCRIVMPLFLYCKLNRTYKYILRYRLVMPLWKVDIQNMIFKWTISIVHIKISLMIWKKTRNGNRKTTFSPLSIFKISNAKVNKLTNVKLMVKSASFLLFFLVHIWPKKKIT